MKAIIFDCDGVLVDSEKLSCSAWLPVLSRLGIQARLTDIEAFIGKSDQAVIDHFNDATGVGLPPGIAEEREREYFALARTRLQTFPHLHDVLTELRQRRIPLAVASSGRHQKIRFSLERVGLDGFFDVICSATEVERGKPAPDLFLLAADRLQMDPRTCAVVEDSVFGIRAARSAAMRALGFTSSFPAPVLLQAGAHRVFSSYREFMSLCAPDMEPENSE